MTSRCSMERCKRSSTILCFSCNKIFCPEHLYEHENQHKSQLNTLTNEIKNLSNRYTQIDQNKLIENFQHKLDKWRDDCYKIIDRLYEQKYEELNRNWREKLTEPQKHIDKMRSELIEFTRKQKINHEDINQSIEAIHFIDQQIKDIEQKGIQIELHPLLFDDSLKSNQQESKIEKFEVMNTLSPYRTIDCSGQSGVAFTGNTQYLLTYEYQNLILFDRDLILIQQSPWTNGQIYDICWSTALKSFIFITNKRSVYLINETKLSFTRIETLQEEKWWSCTCSDQSLFLTTYGTDAHIFQFNLLSSFQLIKYWKSPSTCKQYECIYDINYNNQTLSLIIGNSSNKTARIELRASTTLARLWAFSFNINDTSYQPSIHCCSLKDDEWLIVVENNSNIYHINKDGQLKTTYQYKIPAWNAVLFASNILAIRTENKIFLHKI